jgi:hypothetical protein
MNRSPASFPALGAAALQAVPRQVFPFPEPDFLQVSMTPDHHLIGNTYATWGELSFTTTSMTPWVTHEINRTVAALAAEMRSSPTVADKSCATRKAQPALHPKLPYTRPACFKGIKRVHNARKHGGVLALGRVTRTTDRRMVWLKVCNGRARVMVNKAQHNNWKRKYFTNDVARRQHEL